MPKVAANQKLWNQLMKQALIKYPPKSPKASTTFAANKWAAQQYEQAGGQYVSSKQEVDPKLRDYKTEKEKKQKAKAKQLKKKQLRGGY